MKYFVLFLWGGGGVEKVTLYKNKYRVNCLKEVIKQQIQANPILHSLDNQAN